MFHVGCTPASVASYISIFFLADTKRTKGRMWLCSKNFDVQRNWEKDTAVHSGHLRFMTSPEKSSDTTKEHLRSHIFKPIMQHFKPGKRNKEGMLPHLSILKRMVYCRYWAAIVGACAAGTKWKIHGIDYVPLKSERVSVLHYLQNVLANFFSHTLIKSVIV